MLSDGAQLVPLYSVPLYSVGNPLSKRIFASFSEKKDGTLSKEDWVAACCVLSSRGSKAGLHKLNAVVP